MGSQTKTNGDMVACVFPRLTPIQYLPRALIGLLCCWHSLRLAKVIILGLVLRHSIDPSPKRREQIWMSKNWTEWKTDTSTGKSTFNFSKLAKFQHIRCYISLGNVRWNLTYLLTFVWLGVYDIPPVIQTPVNFSFFISHFLSWYYTWYAETLQGYWSKIMLILVLVALFSFNLIEFSAAILEQCLLNTAVTETATIS